MKNISQFKILWLFLVIGSCQTYDSGQEVDLLLAETIDLLKDKEYKKVKTNAQKALKITPDYLDFNLFLGRAQQMTGEIDKARQNYNLVIEKDKNYKTAFYYLFDLEFQAKNYQRAKEVSEKAIKYYPDEKSFYFKKLSTFQSLGDLQGEYRYIKEIQSKFPNDSDLDKRLANLELRFIRNSRTNALGQKVDFFLTETIDLLNKKKYNKAKINARKALRIAPNYLDFNLVLGRAQQMAGEIDKARQNYNLVIEKDIDYKAAFYYLFDLEFQAENYKRAKEVSEKAIMYYPDEKDFYFKKLSTFKSLEDLKGEYSYIKEIQSKFPNDSDLDRRLVNLENRITGMSQTNALGQEVDSLLAETNDLLKEKEYEKVKVNAQKALKIASDYLDFNLVLGRAQQMTGETDKARQNYNLVIDKDKDYKTAFYYLFDLEFQAKNYQRAKEVSEKAIKYYPDERDFYLKKLSTFKSLGDLQGEYNYIKEIQPKFPDDKDLNRRLVTLELSLFGAVQTIALEQEINVDSLLTKTIDLLKEEKYEKVKVNAQKALKIAPDYFDFNLVLGRAQQMTGETDKARQNYNLVIDKDKDYKTAFYYLFELEFQTDNYQRAKEVSETAITYNPDEKDFYFKKLSTFQSLGDLKGEYMYIKEIQPKFPDDSDLDRRLVTLELRFDFDIAGFNYSFTAFDRDNVGPWHLVSFQYIRQRKWGSLIPRINYANRLSDVSDNRNGIQYELESYFFTGINNYSFIGGSYSNDEVFPTWRLRASHFMFFNKGWGADVGVRYDQTFDDRKFYTAALGINKYFGSNWMNLRSFFMTENEDKYYPAFTLTTRHYLDTRFDYIGLILSYGTNPDERTNLSQIQRRISTESYSADLGYFRMLNQRYLIGIQGGYNYQEFLPNRFQNEYELFLRLQYKFK